MVNASIAKTELRNAFVNKATSMEAIISSNMEEKMENTTFSFTRDKILIQALKDQDKAMIAKRINTTANLLEATKVVSNIRVFSNEGKLLFSRNKGEQDITSNLVQTAINDVNLVKGIEKDASGQINIHFVLPIAPHGKVIGAIDLLVNYDVMLREIARIGAVQVALFNTADKLKYESSKWLKQSIQARKFDVKGDSIEFVSNAKEVYRAVSVPVLDVKNKIIAYTVVLTESTEAKVESDNAFYLGLAAVILWLLIAFVLVNRMMLSAFSPLSGMQKAVENIKNQGDLSIRIDVGTRNEIGLATESINELIEMFQEALHGSNAVMDAVAAGDFSQRIEGKFVGEFENLKDAVNKSTESTALTMSEVTKVVKALEAGDFSVTLDPSVKGEIQNSVASALKTMSAVISETNRVLDAMAKGDFSQQVEVESSGEFKRLADSVNTRIKQTSTALDDISAVVEGISEGDLTKKVEHEYEGKFGMVADLLGVSTENLSKLIGQTALGVQNLVDNVNQIYQGAVDLNDRTQQQAASLEETTAMMAQIGERVKDTTTNAQKANDLAGKARAQADKGAEVMRSTIESMGDIREASSKIEEIISLIDSIAFQTNLLALNAAVEAARAGDHGRGFAVVAGEVRNLAGKSADAARDIKSLIENAVSAIDEGTERAKLSDEALQNITLSIREVSELVADISVASIEQSSSTVEIGQAVADIDNATQQNAALVEETTAASENMKDEASQLAKLVSKFKV